MRVRSYLHVRARVRVRMCSVYWLGSSLEDAYHLIVTKSRCDWQEFKRSSKGNELILMPLRLRYTLQVPRHHGHLFLFLVEYNIN